jgi:hypothetical protein
MAKYEWLSEGMNRKRRIIGRIIQRKSLPQYTYRLDERAPGTIRSTGFQPWNGGGTITLEEHVNGSYGTNSPKSGSTKQDSQWVSTAGYGILKNIDPKFAPMLVHGYIYRIDTALATGTGAFMDVNDFFDKAGENRPFATQREWAKLGGIDQSAVTHYMDGPTFQGQMNGFVGPDEANLTGWQTF